MIVKMDKIAIIGIDSYKSQMIDELMNLGVLQINTQESKLCDYEWSNLVGTDGDEAEVAKLEAAIQKTAVVIEALDRLSTEKKPLFKTRRPVDSQSFEKSLLDVADASSKIDEIYSLTEMLNRLKTDENRINSTIASLAPWEPYGLPLEQSSTEKTSVIIGVLPSIADINTLKADADGGECQAVIGHLSSDSEQHYISVIYYSDCEEEITALLRQYGFSRTSFKDLEGTPAENIAALKIRISEIESQRGEIEKQLSGLLGYKQKLEAYYDGLLIKKDKARIKGRLLTTRSSFYLDGWVPSQAAASVSDAMAKYDAFVEITPTEKGEQFPVLLKNNDAVYPFEAVTNLYSVPLSTGIDPTPFFAFFYFIFYGMMFSDAAYGLLMTAICFIVLRKFRLEGMAKKLITMFMWCGVSTLFWGAMYGSWFGDFIKVASGIFLGREIVIPPLWFDPLSDPMRLLIFCLGLGIVHLFVGMGIKMYMLIKDGDTFAAIADIGMWYLVIVGAVMLLMGGSLSEAGKYISLIGAAGLVLTQGRAEKNIIMKVVKGVGSLYNATSYMSDILSYSRLLALGLSTGVVASVVNVMGSLAGDGILGVILMTVAFFGGHTFNFAINALGSFVHACRLQYVEFFGKFFEGGGDAFEPFVRNTKYVDFID